VHHLHYKFGFVISKETRKLRLNDALVYFASPALSTKFYISKGIVHSSVSLNPYLPLSLLRGVLWYIIATEFCYDAAITPTPVRLLIAIDCILEHTFSQKHGIGAGAFWARHTAYFLQND